MAAKLHLGSKVRATRRKRGLTQVELAKRLGISPSYLNLIEHNQRPLTASLLIKVAAEFQLDFQSFSDDSDDRLASDLIEIFADPMFDAHGLNAADVRELANGSPSVARAILALYQAFQGTRDSVVTLASQIYDDQEAPATTDADGLRRSQLPSEEVTDLIQRQLNHFADLELAAEEISEGDRLDRTDLFGSLARVLEQDHDVSVEVVREARGALRRFDPERGRLVLSELLPASSRAFELAAQLALIRHRALLDRLASAAVELTSAESRSLARAVLANYFAGALLMPYAPFVEAARRERYDIEVLQRRFSANFEQVCHRLTTLRRSGAEGVPFHMIRVDLAGNISKRFSASGIRFARFSGACPRWNVFSAFLTPGLVNVQTSVMPDGTAYFCIARTILRGRVGYHAPQTVQAIGLGCRIEHARDLVYSDGVDFDTLEGAVPVGVTCRLCERTDCEQRAFPSIRHPLEVDENVRGLSFFAPVQKP